MSLLSFFFFQAEDGIRDGHVTGVQTCALPILISAAIARAVAISTPLRLIFQARSNGLAPTEVAPAVGCAPGRSQPVGRRSGSLPLGQPSIKASNPPRRSSLRRRPLGSEASA